MEYSSACVLVRYPVSGPNHVTRYAIGAEYNRDCLRRDRCRDTISPQARILSIVTAAAQTHCYLCPRRQEYMFTFAQCGFLYVHVFNALWLSGVNNHRPFDNYSSVADRTVAEHSE